MLLRRFLVLAAFAFWQGGFTFYAAIVVPIGADVLGGSAEQARITRLVAWHINLAGAVALAVFALDIVSVPRLRRSRAGMIVIAALLLVGLVFLRAYLDQLFHGEDAIAYIDDRAQFRPWHRAYLWISTVQWATCVAFLFLSLAAWRQTDRGTVPPYTKSN